MLVSHWGVLSPNKVKIWVTVAASIDFKVLFEASVWVRSALRALAVAWLAKVGKAASLNKLKCTIQP